MFQYRYQVMSNNIGHKENEHYHRHHRLLLLHRTGNVINKKNEMSKNDDCKLINFTQTLTLGSIQPILRGLWL